MYIYIYIYIVVARLTDSSSQKLVDRILVGLVFVTLIFARSQMQYEVPPIILLAWLSLEDPWNVIKYSIKIALEIQLSGDCLPTS